MPNKYPPIKFISGPGLRSDVDEIKGVILVQVGKGRYLREIQMNEEELLNLIKNASTVLLAIRRRKGNGPRKP